MSDRERLFDEHELRRALRLDGDERPWRLDAAALAAAARRVDARRRALVMMLGGVVATAALSVIVWAQLFALAPAAGREALSLVIGAFTGVATVLILLAQAAAEPVVPVGLVAVLAIVIISELVERRERRHVLSS